MIKKKQNDIDNKITKMYRNVVPSKERGMKQISFQALSRKELSY